MREVSLTEFRSHASGMLTEVEHGGLLVVLRHGRPIAEVRPIAKRSGKPPSWKKPALRLSAPGAALSAAIMSERKRENIF